MNGHDIFIEAHYDHYTNQVDLAVLCSCTALLLESKYDQNQLELDEILDATWAHRDSQADGLVCEII